VATNFPTSLDALTNPTSGSALNSPSHADQHADANDAIEALQAKVGVDGSAVTTSLDYKVTNGIHSSLNVDSGTLVVDATNNRVGVNTASPGTALDVIGTTTVRVAATQDGVALAGRAGGTSSYEVTLQPTTLSADRTLTLPNVSGTAITTGNLTDITSTGTLSSLAVTGDLTIDTNTLRVDSSNNRVGVNVTSPAVPLDVVGRVEVRAAATQDGVALAGRAGGTSSYEATLTPTTLTADRTLTLPDVSGTAITTGNLTDITATGTVTSGTWSGSFGSVSGANLTTLNASNLSSGTVASARVSGSYTSISRVGTLDCASNAYINDTSGVFGMANTGATGTGNAAHWLLIFGAYFLYRNTSTRDDKENFQPLGDVITPSMVDQINVELWNRKTAPGLPEIGPMAEDMDAISPFLSTRGIDADADGNIIPTPPTGINQNGWLSLLTIALQDCRQRIVELENR